jgi:hypothetical protein
MNINTKYKFNMKGWFNDSWRHMLAAKGVKTKHMVFKGIKTKSILMHKHCREDIAKDYAKRLKGSKYTKQLGGVDADAVELALRKYMALKEKNYDDMAVEMFSKSWRELSAEQKQDVTHALRKYMALKPEEIEKMKKARNLLGSISAEEFKELEFSDRDDVSKADIEKALAEIRQEEKSRDIKAFAGEEPEATDVPGVVEFKKKEVPFISVEKAEIAQAQKMREEGTAFKGEGDLTSSNVRKIIRDANFKLNPYAQTYVDALEDSEAMYGTRGVSDQIAYILSNLRASGPEQQAAKKKLQKLSQEG